MWASIQLIAKSQTRLSAAVRKDFDRRAALNETAISQQVQTAQRVLDTASRAAGKYALQESNISSLMKRDRERAALKAKVVGETEASLKVCFYMFSSVHLVR